MLPLLFALSACGLAEDERDEKNKYEYLVFSDAAFEAYCLELFDLNRDGRISRYEAQRVLTMDCSNRGIASLYEIGDFSRLQRLNCSRNLLTTLDLRGLNALENLDCSDNRLTRLDVRGLRSLTALSCFSNLLAALDLGSNASLSRFDGRTNRYPTLDVRGCATTLAADVTDNPRLGTVYCLPTQNVAADGHTQLVR